MKKKRLEATHTAASVTTAYALTKSEKYFLEKEDPNQCNSQGNLSAGYYRSNFATIIFLPDLLLQRPVEDGKEFEHNSLVRNYRVVINRAKLIANLVELSPAPNLRPFFGYISPATLLGMNEEQN